MNYCYLTGSKTAAGSILFYGLCVFVCFVVFVFGKTGSTQKLNWASLYVYHIGIHSLLPYVKKKCPVSSPVVRSLALYQRTEL